MSKRKRLLKLAARIPLEEVQKSLPIDDRISGWFLVGTDPEEYLICCWHALNGAMINMNDGDIHYVARKQYLLSTGIPAFRTFEEVDEYAASQGWSCSKSIE